MSAGFNLFILNIKYGSTDKAISILLKRRDEMCNYILHVCHGFQNIAEKSRFKQLQHGRHFNISFENFPDNNLNLKHDEQRHDVVYNFSIKTG